MSAESEGGCNMRQTKPNADWTALTRKKLGEHIAAMLADRKDPITDNEWKQADLARVASLIFVADLLKGQPDVDPYKTIQGRISNLVQGKIPGFGRSMYSQAIRRALEIPDSDIPALEARYNEVMGINHDTSSMTASRKNIDRYVAQASNVSGEFKAYETLPGHGGTMTIGTEATKTIKTPAGLEHLENNQDVLPVRICANRGGSSYRDGDIVIASRVERARIGDDVFICPENEAENPARMLRRLIGFTDFEWICEGLQSGSIENVPRADWPVLLPIKYVIRNPDAAGEQVPP